MNMRPEPTIRKFNPGTFQSDEEVIRQFVARKRELDIVLEVLRGNIEAPSCQHTLIVAPRGRGKTMLLSRVAAELRTNDLFSNRLLPVRFMEESQEIMTAGDFWLEALFHLASETAKSDPVFSHELRAARDDLASRWHGNELDLRARATVLDAADRLRRRLVLMVENMQDLCADVDDDFGWKLREALQTQPEITLLATATSRFKELDDPAQPFFEQFRTLHLDPLETEECRRLWAVVSGDDVKDREVRPLQILTGGSPRLLVIIAQFARHRSLRHLMEDLVTLIDDHTEYFRSHLQAMAKVERLVYLAVIALWQPSSTSEIARRCRRDIRTVSAMLGRLVNRGAVTIEGSGKKRRYAATERLYSIYYILRRQRDEAAVIQNLIRFMAAFYHGTELQRTIIMLSSEARSEPSIRVGIERACAVDRQVSEFFSSTLQDHTKQVAIARNLFDRSLGHFMSGEHDAASEVCSELIERFGRSTVPAIQEAVAVAQFNYGLSLRRKDRFADAIEVYDELVVRYAQSQVAEVQEAAAGALVDKGLTLGREGRFAEEIETYDELVDRFGHSSVAGIQEHVAHALFHKGETLARQERLSDVSDVCNEIVERFGDSQDRYVLGHVANALFIKGVTLGQVDRFEEAIEVYDELVERYGDSKVSRSQEHVARALLNKGQTLGRAERISEAIAVYDDLINRYGSSDVSEIQEYAAHGLFNKGIALWRQDRFTAEIEVYDELVERYGGSEVPDIQEHVAMALFNKGLTLWRQNRSAAEIEAYDDLVERFSGSEESGIQRLVAHALYNKGVTLSQQERFANAIEAHNKLVKRYGDSETREVKEWVAMALIVMADSYLELDKAGEALHTCEFFERYYHAMKGATDVELVGQSELIKVRAMIRRSDHDDAMSVFRSVYATFIPGDEVMNQMLKLLIDFAAAGAQRSLLDILLTDDDKADMLAPFIVVLRKQLGEQVRAPAEVLEVADDIIEQIELRRTSDSRS